MRKYGCATVLLAYLISNSAFAGTFDVPDENPRLTISVPDKWSPNHSDDGVDASSPDNSIFFSLYTDKASGAASVQKDSLAILTRNGMTIEMKPAAERSASFGGLNWMEDEYKATQDGKPQLVRLDAAILSGKTYAQLLVWGTPEGMKKNGGNLGKLFATIKLKAH